MMGFEFLMNEKRITVPVSYMGIDKNPLWAPIHQNISNYCNNVNIRFLPYHEDVFKFFQDYYVSDVNIIVISYLISHLYNTGQISEIDDLARYLVNTIQKKDTPLLLVINDVNSYKRGRDFFSHFLRAIQNSGLTVSKSEYKYFDTGNLYDGQRLGTPYSVNHVVSDIPDTIKRKYHAIASINQTVQLLVEVS